MIWCPCCPWHLALPSISQLSIFFCTVKTLYLSLSLSLSAEMQIVSDRSVWSNMLTRDQTYWHKCTWKLLWWSRNQFCALIVHNNKARLRVFSTCWDGITSHTHVHLWTIWLLEWSKKNCSFFSLFFSLLLLIRKWKGSCVCFC